MKLTARFLMFSFFMSNFFIVFSSEQRGLTFQATQDNKTSQTDTQNQERSSSLTLDTSRIIESLDKLEKNRLEAVKLLEKDNEIKLFFEQHYDEFIKNGKRITSQEDVNNLAKQFESAMEKQTGFFDSFAQQYVRMVPLLAKFQESLESLTSNNDCKK